MLVRSYAILWSALACMILSMGAHASSQKTWRVGIVLDGPWAREQHLLKMLEDEVVALTSGEFDVRFPKDKILHGNWSLQGVNRAIDQQLRDPRVDLVLALGPVSSSQIARKQVLPKPVFAPAIFGLQTALPRKGDASGVRNLNYLYSFNKAPSDVLLLHELKPFKRLAILVDPLIYDQRSRFQIDELLKQIPAEERYLISANGTPEQIVDSIPADADAVLVLALLRLDMTEVKQLSELLIERGLPSVSSLGGNELEAGMLAATSTEQDLVRLGRRIAMNIQRALLGEDPGSFSVDFKRSARPTINMNVAHRLGLSPSFDLLNSSRLIGSRHGGTSESIQLPDAVRMALEHNLSLNVSESALNVTVEDIALARSRLKPQIDFSLDGREIDPDRAAASGANASHWESSASINLNQVIYSERARSNLRIQRLLQEARTVEHKGRILDVILETSIAYLNVLRADELQRIRREDLSLTRANLERARIRVELGAANRAESLRWESEIATAKSRLVDASVMASQSRINLSRLVNRPLETHYRAEPMTLDDPNLLISSPKFQEYIASPATVEVLRDYLVQVGMQREPQLRQINLAIEAQKQAVDSARNTYTHPVVGLGGQVTEILSRGGAGAEDPAFGPAKDNTDWNIGLSARLPLYSGGARSSDVRRRMNELVQLQAQKDQAAQAVESRIRSNTYASGGAFRNIQWARERFDAARENLGMTTDAYSRGAVDITALLDAQNAAVNSESAAANAVYDFLIQYMQLQRAMGDFDFLMSSADRQEMHTRLGGYFEARAMGQPYPTFALPVMQARKSGQNQAPAPLISQQTSKQYHSAAGLPVRTGKAVGNIAGVVDRIGPAMSRIKPVLDEMKDVVKKQSCEGMQSRVVGPRGRVLPVFQACSGL